MYSYQASEFALIVSMICGVVCTIACIHAFKNNGRKLQDMVCIQAFLLGTLCLFYLGLQYISGVKMENQLRENFIPDTKAYRLNTLRYQLYDGFGDNTWYKNGATSPDFLGLYDLDTGTFTYYAKLKSFDILKR